MPQSLHLWNEDTSNTRLIRVFCRIKYIIHGKVLRTVSGTSLTSSISFEGLGQNDSWIKGKYSLLITIRQKDQDFKLKAVQGSPDLWQGLWLLGSWASSLFTMDSVTLGYCAERYHCFPTRLISLQAGHVSALRSHSILLLLFGRIYHAVLK